MNGKSRAGNVTDVRLATSSVLLERSNAHVLASAASIRDMLDHIEATTVRIEHSRRMLDGACVNATPPFSWWRLADEPQPAPPECARELPA